MHQPSVAVAITLTGKRKIIHKLCLHTNDDIGTIAKKANTSINNVSKEVSELKNKGLLPPKFTLRGRGNSGFSGYVTQEAKQSGVADDNDHGRTDSSSHDDMQTAKSKQHMEPQGAYPALQSGRKPQQEKSLRVRVWKMIKKGIPDEEIIMKLDASPVEFRRLKAEYLRTKGQDSLVRIYEKQEEGLDDMLELDERMRAENMKPSQFIRSLMEERRQEEEKLRVLKEEVSRYEKTYASLKKTVEGLEEDCKWLSGDLESLDKKESKLREEANILENFIAGLKNEEIYKNVMGMLRVKGDGILYDEEFLSTMADTIDSWSTDAAKQSKMKKLHLMRKNNDRKGADHIILAIQKEMLEKYIVQKQLKVLREAALTNNPAYARDYFRR